MVLFSSVPPLDHSAPPMNISYGCLLSAAKDRSQDSCCSWCLGGVMIYLVLSVCCLLIAFVISVHLFETYFRSIILIVLMWLLITCVSNHTIDLVKFDYLFLFHDTSALSASLVSLVQFWRTVLIVFVFLWKWLHSPLPFIPFFPFKWMMGHLPIVMLLALQAVH